MTKYEQIAMYMIEFDKDLEIRKKTLKWKINNLWYRIKKWVN
jgi:hypothetical protein